MDFRTVQRAAGDGGFLMNRKIFEAIGSSMKNVKPRYFYLPI